MRTVPRPFVLQAAVLAAGALAAAGCVSREAPFADARFAPASPSMSVACEPSQRAVVQPVVVNGATMSQVACVSTDVVQAPISGASGFQTVSYTPQAAAGPVVSYQPAPVYQSPRVIPATYSAPAPAPRRVVTEPVQRYERRPATRSVKKSAIIIGSSAGAGAGLGAAIGGKKGAAIGALLGGGGATLWDQITRHKNR